MQELLKKYYEEFKGLPSNRPIVRNNQINDAFELVVLNILYAKELDFTFNKEHINEIAKYIIAPPDSGIDIFVEKENGDEFSYDVIQVKNCDLTESELRHSITDMKRTILDYCKNPKLVQSESCREIISNSSFDKNKKANCQYYVVHTGSVRDFAGSEDDEHIITTRELEIIRNNKADNVEEGIIPINKSGNFMIYGNKDDEQRAIICSVSGYELAIINNDYYSTERGRNILFGQNLREAINTNKSKTYDGMKKTIIKCPENFWYYNNGITIISDCLDGLDVNEEKCSFENSEKIEKVKLKNFSIVNGAQTTSSLGMILKDALKNKEDNIIESLKKVYVLVRILQVSEEDMRRDIAIYNNTQNPITSRDMVANRDEQKKLHDWLLDETYPQIYVEIRRGAQIPCSFNKGISHRKITNEELAQLAYASFLQQPFTAKDKKKTLFNNDYTQNDYTLNQIYHKIFNYDEHNKAACGILFNKTKIEIDEALFVQYLYKESKKYLKKIYQERILKEEERKLSEGSIEKINDIDARISEYSSLLETVGVCMFYFIALYYEFKEQFGDQSSCKIYNFDRFYSDKLYKAAVIKDAANLFLTLTIKVLKKTATDANKSGNINNWVRSLACQEKFFAELRDEIATNIELEEKYKDFVEAHFIDIKLK